MSTIHRQCIESTNLKECFCFIQVYERTDIEKQLSERENLFGYALASVL
jgi:hypothetical protein